MVTKDQFLGNDDSKLANLVLEPPRIFNADRDAKKAFEQLVEHAYSQGFEIGLVSAYRSFYQQFKIFDDKFRGKRPVLDENEKPIDISLLSDKDKVLNICRFSAIPGLSRHHFGTDFDIYAKNLLPKGKTLELTAREYQKGNYFYQFGQYLANNLSKFGFIRPFNGKGLIAFEPWHISYEKKANEFLKAFNIDDCIEFLGSFNEPWVEYAIAYAKEHYKELLVIK